MSSLKSKLTASVKQAKASSGEATLRTEAASEKPQKRSEPPKKKSSSLNSSVNANVVGSHHELFPSRVWPD